MRLSSSSFYRDDQSIRLSLPAIQTIAIETLDFILVSDAFSILNLAVLTTHFGFQGDIYMTEMTFKTGRVMVDEILHLVDTGVDVSFEVSQPLEVAGGELCTLNPFQANTGALYRISRNDVDDAYRKVRSVGFCEVIRLPYGLQITALSSGLSMGSCLWTISDANEKLTYIPAASADSNRHAKKIDIASIGKTDAILLTDLRVNRDPLTTTEKMMETLLNHVSRILDQRGTALILTPPCTINFDLIETIYALLYRKQQSTSIVYLSSCAEQFMELTNAGADWLCEKRIDKLFAGEDPFLISVLKKKKILHPLSSITTAALTELNNGGVVFATYASLHSGNGAILFKSLADHERNALLLIDPSEDHQAPLFSNTKMEIIRCPIDPRLNCGDANQLLACCCPESLIVPEEYTLNTTAESDDMSNRNNEGSISDANDQEISRFSRVLPLHLLLTTFGKQKCEPATLPMKLLNPLTIDKNFKFVDGLLDAQFAAQVPLNEVAGRAVGYLSGRLQAERDTFIVKPPGIASSNGPAEILLTGEKRKATSCLSPESHPSESYPDFDRIKYEDNCSIILGTVDEEKLSKRITARDPSIQIFISELGHVDTPEVLMNLPGLDARITFWKNEHKTLVEAESEEVRQLLTSHILAQLSVLKH
uniref:Integrator complex subunit putative n=1 Tax=Albugo laibachii Nc14 TaxID=890382 RepID=F0WIR5_9STRA|nr:integrator complex subunit putative [Albugo laibachii Nc14]|eukprot:CCA21159.1 integrator complex subunit putative [Albugo laibachii Nc14]